MLAPIVLFTYNRLEHTQKTVEALLNNILADKSELFIFSDGGKDELSWQKVNNLREYLKTIKGFKKIEIIESPINKGLANFIIEGVTSIINKYGKIIVLEDDIITGKHFLEFLNEALETYEHEAEVGTIAGYLDPELTPKNNFFSRKGSAWGWATWKRTWDLFETDGQKLLNQINERNLAQEFDFYGSYPFYQMLKDQIEGKNNSWAIRFYASYFLNNKLNLIPCKSLVHNIGFDDSGIHCNATKHYDTKVFNGKIKLKKQKIEENLRIKESYILKHTHKKSLSQNFFSFQKDNYRINTTIFGIKISFKNRIN